MLSLLISFPACHYNENISGNDNDILASEHARCWCDCDLNSNDNNSRDCLKNPYKTWHVTLTMPVILRGVIVSSPVELSLSISISVLYWFIALYFVLVTPSADIIQVSSSLAVEAGRPDPGKIILPTHHITQISQRFHPAPPWTISWNLTHEHLTLTPVKHLRYLIFNGWCFLHLTLW